MPILSRLFALRVVVVVTVAASLISPATGLMAASADRPAEHEPAAAAQLFHAEVLPVLRKRCFGCHGEQEALEGNLDLRSRAAMLKGGESGEPTLVPGKPGESLLYLAVLRDGDYVMPPKERNRPTGAEIESLRRWIEAGAPWPDRPVRPATTGDAWSADDGIEMATSGGLSDDWTHRRYKREDVWAFFPVKTCQVPEQTLVASSTNNPVDAFVLRKLRQKPLTPAPAADKRTWIRRATFDLAGLPPTPAEVDAFLADDSADAYAKVIDRLLASPHYGERMAQHWLDVVRYADTGGFANDYERPNAWRYRDYVIRSFNEDTPFDRFIVEQIAGDELDPNDPEMRVAVGFLRMGPWEHTGMSVAAVTRQLFLDDVTNAVGVSFLGQQLNCCKCHDHKFDPLPTRDYYRVQAVFATTQFDQALAPFLPGEKRSDFAPQKKAIEAILNDAKWMTTDDPGNDSARRISRKRKEYLTRAGQRYEPTAFSVKTGGSQVIRILMGGSLESPADPVKPGIISAVQFADRPGAPTKIPQTLAGRRLALARWIADARNPLTARVIVNRVWQMHFGRGIVSTPNNFGKTGARPTHPELLDWLATWFVQNGWSIKKLHRLVMLSDTYYRGSHHPGREQVDRVDANNQLLSYFPPRRLTAEELRDALLAVTGELNVQMGGPGVYPEINWEVAMQPRHIMGSIAPAYQPSPTRDQRNRRTVYVFRYRTLANPMLEVFNRPGPDVSCECRDETTVTPQVFALFNGEDIHRRALALAIRLEQSSDAPEQRIDHAFRLLYGRLPTGEQRRTCLEHVARMIEHHRELEPPRSQLPVSVSREMIDEQTGKPFHWTEKLHNMLAYEPDVQPADVAPETRALAELCLVLLNSNEFVYVY
jgi:hypothetical protein